MIEARANWTIALGGFAFIVAGTLLLVFHSQVEGSTGKLTQLLTPYLQITIIALGVAGMWRFLQLALQRAPLLTADASGISIDGGPTIPWNQIASVGIYEYAMRGTHRGLLIKLTDRSAIATSQLGTFWTRFARRGTPGDVFLPEVLIRIPLAEAVTEITAQRPIR